MTVFQKGIFVCVDGGGSRTYNYLVNRDEI